LIFQIDSVVAKRGEDVVATMRDALNRAGMGNAENGTESHPAQVRTL
jgi:hypothetical protein